MRFLRPSESVIAEKYFHKAAKLALNSECLKDKCGSVIVHNNQIIGRGFNSPPGDKSIEYCLKETLPEDFKSEKHCCIHAEQRAVMDALKNYPNLKKYKDTRIYFTRADKDGKILMSGRPYCTICSKMALDAGIKEWALRHNLGIFVYGAEEYNSTSFEANVR